MHGLLLLLTLFTSDTFHIQEKTGPRIKIRHSKQLYEDSTYVVSGFCDGEFGAVTFKDKHTGVSYAERTDCPIAVNRVREYYYITTMSRGISMVLKGPDPKVYAAYAHKTELGVAPVLLLNTKKLAASFACNNELYHIVLDADGTSLAKMDDEQLITIARLSEKKLIPYKAAIFKKDTDHYIYPFKEGYIDINKSEITIIRYK